ERNAGSVAVDDLHIFDRYAQPAGHDLRECRLMPLAVTVGSGEHSDAAGGIDAHLADFEQPRARAERARDVRRCDTAGLDVRRVADAAQLAALGRFGLARR